jgi:hypothetical protein
MPLLVRLLIVTLAIAAPASACSLHVPWVRYVNLVSMSGATIDGLEWVRIHNILDYQGEERVLVSVVRQGKRSPLLRWEDGKECAFDAAGVESCHPNLPSTGVRLESQFWRWKEASEEAGSLKRVYLPLIVEIGGREVRLVLSSKAVRNTRELQRERVGRYINEICERLEYE